MNTMLDSRTLRTPPPNFGVIRDDRGAIMVLGIFMCTTLVGALWYIAGLGDAVVYRERLQEAADAAAFSGAVFNARGMNLLVLINLIMACVLAVRVALKVVQVALVFAAVVFAGLAFIPGMQWMAAIANLARGGAQLTQQIINNTRSPIDNTLKALSTAGQGIARVVPGASILGAEQVSEKYKPFLKLGFASPPVPKLTAGLPVDEGTTDRLCAKAGEAVGHLLGNAVPIDLGAAKDKFAGIMGKIVKAGAGYFCELGGTGGPPDLSAMTEETANDRCDSEATKKRNDYEDASRAWHAECNADGVTCIDADQFVRRGGAPEQEMSGLEYDRLQASRKPDDQAKVGRLTSAVGVRDSTYEIWASFDHKACADKQKKDLTEELNKLPPAQQGTSQGKTPKKVVSGWANGSNDAQILSYVTAADDGSLLKRSPRGVRIGAMKDRRGAVDIGTPAGYDFAYAQAEFFYDCTGKWESSACNGDANSDKEEAMWHLRWRARLRRYNAPFKGAAGSLIDDGLDLYLAANGLSLGKAIVSHLGFRGPGNMMLVGRLTLLEGELAALQFDKVKLH